MSVVVKRIGIVKKESDSKTGSFFVEEILNIMVVYDDYWVNEGFSLIFEEELEKNHWFILVKWWEINVDMFELNQV